MMQLEFQKLRSAKLDAEMKAQTLETDLVSSQQERDAEFMSISEEMEKWKRLAHNEKVRYDGIQSKVEQLEKENGNLKSEWSRAVKGKMESEDMCEVLEGENWRLKILLKQHRGGGQGGGHQSTSTSGSRGRASGSSSKASTMNIDEGMGDLKRLLRKKSSTHDIIISSKDNSTNNDVSSNNNRSGSKGRRSRSSSADGVREMMEALKDVNASIDRKGGGIGSPSRSSSTKQESNRGGPPKRYDTPPSSPNTPFESIMNAAFSSVYSSSSSNRQYQAPASWHGGKKIMKKSSLRKIPLMAPPLDNSSRSSNNSNSNKNSRDRGGDRTTRSGTGGASSFTSSFVSTTSKTGTVTSIPTAVGPPPHASWKSSMRTSQGTNASSFTSLHSLGSALSKMHEEEDDDDDDKKEGKHDVSKSSPFDRSGIALDARSLDGMVVLMEDMLGMELKGAVDNDDDDYYGMIIGGLDDDGLDKSTKSAL